jgi:hypothetical protein
MNITQEQPKKQPSIENLEKMHKELLKLVVHRGSRPSKCNPINDAAKKFGYTRQGISRILYGKVKDWKPHHYEIYNFLKFYLSDN